MGALAELGDELPVTSVIVGEGKRLVEWWDDIADDDDRALLRQWARGPRDGGKTQGQIADLLAASGFPIGRHTVERGMRLLRRYRWES